MTLIEILVVVTILAMISGGIAIGVMKGMADAKLQMAAAETLNIRSSVTLFRIPRGSECPTVKRLVEEEILDEGMRGDDPWGNTYRIVCTGARVTVISNGPDGEADTEDDIRAPKKRRGDE